MDATRLESIPLFAALSKREREQVARLADEAEVPAGRHLMDEGRYAYEFFAILGGTAEVLDGDGRTIATLGPGDIFGEVALVEDQPRTASVVASTPMTVVVMTDRAFRELDRELPAFREHVRRVAAERSRPAPD